MLIEELKKTIKYKCKTCNAPIHQHQIGRNQIYCKDCMKIRMQEYDRARKKIMYDYQLNKKALLKSVLCIVEQVLNEAIVNNKINEEVNEIGKKRNKKKC